MYDFAELEKIIREELEKEKWDKQPSGLYEPVRYIMNMGGKRLRPVLTLMACNLFKEKVNDALRPALGIELFHNFTLMHDDIMDKSSMRRNQATVHTKWNENTAILSGDAMMIMAYGFFHDQQSPLLPDILNTFHHTALQVCEGQQYDMEFENRDNVSLDEYLRMIGLKTAALIAASMKIGALAAGATRNDVDCLYHFGWNCGMIFQLQDDYLDVYGDAETFGKNIGGDILCNKKTFLLISAMEQAKGKTLENLKKQIHAREFVPAEKISAVTSIYNELKVNELLRKKMDEFYSSGLLYLDKVSVSDEKKTGLISLMKKLMSRIK